MKSAEYHNATQSYRRGYVEGRSGCGRNVYWLEAGATDIEEYDRGFADGYEEWRLSLPPEALGQP